MSRNAAAQETPAPLPPPAVEPLPAAAPVAPTAAAPVTPAVPDAGHVYVPKLAPRSESDAKTMAPAAPIDAATATDDDAEPTTGPVRGFMMEARLSQTLGTGGGSRGTLGNAPGAPPIGALGYRADRVGVLFGPSFSHYGGNSAVVSSTMVGLSFHLEITVARTEDRVNEGYILAALTLGNTSFDSDSIPSALAASAAVGFGARHWATRHLACGVELGEGYADVPSITVGSSAYSSQVTYRITRSTALDTFGALTAAVVF